MDKFRDLKNTLLNFIDYAQTNGLPSTNKAAFVDTFVESQFPGEQSDIPTCSHCGSVNVVAGDFKDELFLDRETEEWTVPADPASAGPAWVCQAPDCHTYSPRVT